MSPWLLLFNVVAVFRQWVFGLEEFCVVLPANMEADMVPLPQMIYI